MAAVAAGAVIAGTILQIRGQRDLARESEERERERRENALWYGRQQRRRAELEARRLDQKAGESIAAGQREKMEIERLTRLTDSRALALAAASGGGATSPTAINIMGNIAKRGAYEAAIATYNAETRARDLRIEAATRRLEGRIAEEAGERGMNDEFDRGGQNLIAAGTILSGAGSLFMRYGTNA